LEKLKMNNLEKNNLNSIITSELSSETVPESSDLKSKKIKKILIIYGIVLAILTAGYFILLSRANLFIKINIPIDDMYFDGNLTTANNSNIWKIKADSGGHAIEISEPGYSDYIETFQINRWIPHFKKINLIKREILRLKKGYQGNLENSDMISLTFSADESKILFYDKKENSLSEINITPENTETSAKTLTKLGFLSEGDQEKIYKINWSPNKEMAMVEIPNYSVEQKSINNIFWIISLKDGVAAKVNDSVPNKFSADWSGDGSKIFVVSEGEASKSLFLTDVDGSNPQKLGDFDKSANGFTLSPDGKNIAYLQVKNSDLKVIIDNLDNKKNHEVSTKESVPFASAPIWSLDSKNVMYSGNDKNMILISTSGKLKTINTKGKVEKFLWLDNGGKYLTAIKDKYDLDVSVFYLNGKVAKSLSINSLDYIDILVNKNLKKLLFDIGGSVDIIDY